MYGVCVEPKVLLSCITPYMGSYLVLSINAGCLSGPLSFQLLSVDGNWLVNAQDHRVKTSYIISRLMIVSRTAKESRIYMRAIIKNATTVRIYTHNNGACIHHYRNTMLPY